MKKTIIAAAAILLAVLVSYRPTQAQGGYPPEGYGVETNEWYGVCDPNTLDPNEDGFYFEEFRGIDDAAENDGNLFINLFYETNPDYSIQWPPSYLQEYDKLDNYVDGGGPECYWKPQGGTPLWSDVPTTPIKDFSHEVLYADLTFMFYYYDDNIFSVFRWLPYRVIASWDDGSETYYDGTLDNFVNTPMEKPGINMADPINAYGGVNGFVYVNIAPRSGRTLNSVVLTFPYQQIPWGDWTQYFAVFAPPGLFVDQILIRGFYQTDQPTPTPTRTPFATTPTTTPTRLPTGIFQTPVLTATSTPTGVPMPPSINLPRDYSHVPTSIPVLSFPAWPAVPTLAPVNTPVSLPTRAQPTVVALFTPRPLTFSPATPSANPTVAATLDTWADDLISYTHSLSEDVASMVATDTMAIYTAPDWYAPQMPRDMANIGWTFEQLGNQSNASERRYSISGWAWLFGTMAAMPFKLAKSLIELFRFMGPFAVFAVWLVFLAFPFVLWVKAIRFIKNLIIRIFNFLLAVLDWILKLWEAIPFIG